MTAFSSGGARLAMRSPVWPPQDRPIMPTAPEHHGWAASQRKISFASLS